MRERILSEGWQHLTGKLEFSCRQVEIAALLGEAAEGFFTVSQPEGLPAEGFVHCYDERMECLTPYFCGSVEQIAYRYDTQGMQPGESREGYFFILSNLGEYQIPYRVEAQEKALVSSLGEIQDLFGFVNLARASWQEAVQLFYEPAFAGVLEGQEESVRELYRGFSGAPGNEGNLERFLVAIRKKHPVTYSCNTAVIQVNDLQGQASQDIYITRNGWGATHLTVETAGDFLSTEKSWLGDDDFLGNQCRLPLFFDAERMHGGRNFGGVTISWDGGQLFVEVTAQRSRPRLLAKDGRRRELKQCTARLVELYQDMRMKRMAMEDWYREVGECVERMAHLTERSAVPKLFMAQLYITQDKMEEAGFILEHVEPFLQDAEPAVCCYYLYLTTLYRRQEGYVAKAARKVEEIFARYPEDWRIAWLLLFLSAELNKSAARKWAFLERQFAGGCTSPVLYLEAVLLLCANPALLIKLDRTARQILYYGARHKLLSQDLVGHIINLAGREKYFDRRLFEILRLSYENRPDTETLQAVCTLLIKGGKTGAAYYPWYLKGVSKELRITRLYEHYMRSVDLDKEVQIPRTVLLYFAYQSNLEMEYAAYLYAYMEKHREQEPDLYVTYRPQMDRFVLQQLKKGRINRHLAFLYQRILPGPLLDAEQGAALAALITKAQITWADAPGKKLVVLHQRLRRESVYVLQDGSAYVDLYSPRDILFAEDERGSRFLAPENVRATALFTDGRLFEMLAPYAGEEPGFFLQQTDTRDVQITPENTEGYLRIALEPGLSPAYGRKVRLALMNSLFEQERMVELDRLLRQVQAAEFFGTDRLEVIRLLVLRGFYEKAYQFCDGCRLSGLDVKILLRLCSRLLEKEPYRPEKRLTAMCFATALQGKYDGNILQQLANCYVGSIRELEVIWQAAEGFGLDTYLLCRRMMVQLLYTGADVTERMELLRRYTAEGGPSDLEAAFLHRCCESYVLEGIPIHISYVKELARMEAGKEQISDLCRIAFLRYYIRNKDARDAKTDLVLKQMGTKLLAEGKQLPELQEYADLLPEAVLLLDKSFVVYKGGNSSPAILHWRILREQEAAGDYESRQMQPVCSGIYTQAFVLFAGETLQYYVTEEGTDKITDSGLLKAAAVSELNKKSRYGMLQEAAMRSLEHTENGAAALEDYLYTDFCVNSLFVPVTSV